MTEELGAGIALDETLDFSINGSGDIASTSGAEELEKDLSFQLLIILSDFKGQPLRPETESEIKSLTVDTISSDVRVDEVDRGSVEVEKPGREAIRIGVPVSTLQGEHELVFNL